MSVDRNPARHSRHRQSVEYLRPRQTNFRRCFVTIQPRGDLWVGAIITRFDHQLERRGAGIRFGEK